MSMRVRDDKMIVYAIVVVVDLGRRRHLHPHRPLPTPPTDVVTLLGFIAFSLLLLALPLAFWAVSGRSLQSQVRLLVAVANLLLTTQLVLRWWQSGHFPISNLSVVVYAR